MVNSDKLILAYMHYFWCTTRYYVVKRHETGDMPRKKSTSPYQLTVILVIRQAGRKCSLELREVSSPQIAFSFDVLSTTDCRAFQITLSRLVSGTAQPCTAEPRSTTPSSRSDLKSSIPNFHRQVISAPQYQNGEDSKSLHVPRCEYSC